MEQCFCFYSFETVSLYSSPGCPRTFYVNQATFNLEILLPAFQVLGLNICSAWPGVCLTRELFFPCSCRQQCAPSDFLLSHEPQHHDSESQSDNCRGADHAHQCRVRGKMGRGRECGERAPVLQPPSGEERVLCPVDFCDCVPTAFTRV